jgi:hypothetical protein
MKKDWVQFQNGNDKRQDRRGVAGRLGVEGPGVLIAGLAGEVGSSAADAPRMVSVTAFTLIATCAEADQPSENEAARAVKPVLVCNRPPRRNRRRATRQMAEARRLKGDDILPVRLARDDWFVGDGFVSIAGEEGVLVQREMEKGRSPLV